ncbi:MAG: hypothetical protein ACYDB9_09800 [Gammaproteobacteria bacterium]
MEYKLRQRSIRWLVAILSAGILLGMLSYPLRVLGQTCVAERDQYGNLHPCGWSAHETNGFRKAIIERVLQSGNPPAIPPEANADEGRALYIFKHATSENDYLGAVKQYLKASEAAPWVAKYYFNLCVILGKTPFLQQAVHACRLYLEAAPNASDADAVHQRIAGLQYALGNIKNRMSAAHSATYNGFRDLYGSAGVLGQVDGFESAVGLVVKWQAAPPRYAVMFSCQKAPGDDFARMYTSSIDINLYKPVCRNNDHPHLVIDHEGKGFVQFSGTSSGNLRATLHKLFKIRRKAMGRSPIFRKGRHFYVEVVQGGPPKIAGYAMYESDCNGKPLRQDLQALPDDFIPYSNPQNYGPFHVYSQRAMEAFRPCADQFFKQTGFRFGNTKE